MSVGYGLSVLPGMMPVDVFSSRPVLQFLGLTPAKIIEHLAQRYKRNEPLDTVDGEKGYQYIFMPVSRELYRFGGESESLITVNDQTFSASNDMVFLTPQGTIDRRKTGEQLEPPTAQSPIDDAEAAYALRLLADQHLKG